MRAELHDRIDQLEQGYVIDARGLDLHGWTPTAHDWEQLGRDLQTRREGVSWAVVDWLLLHRGEWGDRYVHAGRVTGRSYAYLRNLYSLGQAFPRDKRVLGMSQHAHREVLALPPEEQRPLLVRARDEKWILPKLEQAVSARRRELDRQTQAVVEKPTKARVQKALARVRCPQCQHVFPVKPHRVW